jgi:glycolate oxidase iron-sulfur subunit
VEYHRLYDIGKEVVAKTTPRPWRERLSRWTIRAMCLPPWRLRLLLALGRPVRALLPAALKSKIPARIAAGALPSRVHDRRMSLLTGCVQAAAAPQINAANRRVFDAVGITLSPTPGVGCCGALSFHLGAVEEGRALARRNIDAWTRELDGGSEAIIVNASGCAAFIRDYADVLAEDPVYAARARRVAAHLRDPVQVLEASPPTPARAPAQPRIAVHASCTLRNGPGLEGAPARLLASLGYEPQPVANAHLCCGSAGAYSLLQPAIAGRLRDDKIAALNAGAPDVIYTANIGCLMHLDAASPVPVRHWIEAVDDLLEH